MNGTRFFTRVLALALAAQTGAAALAQGMRSIDTPYYTLKTDFPAERAKEAALRITKMFDEYQRRTSDFAGRVNRKLLFELHSDYDRYVQSSGAPGTAGIYTGERLVAVYQPQDPIDTWHTVQHEGFHQFVDFAMDRDAIPIWANEGLAEYFGECIYAGDSFYSGAIPPRRLARVQKALRDGEFRPLLAMMNKSHEQWNAEMAGGNYDQAWMMVHFLAHADDGKYAKPFGRFLANAHRAPTWQQSWKANFGGDVGAFQERWEKYWTRLPENPTVDIYGQATVAAITSFYGRAFSQRQIFETWDEFKAAAEKKQLKHHEADWLPPALLKQALADTKTLGDWSIEKRPGRRVVVCELKEGRRVEGDFKVRENQIQDVDVRVLAAKKKSKED